MSISCETDLGDLMPVSNHEGKAIVLGGMEPGEAYGATALHRDLFVGPQGRLPAYEGAVSNQLDYCTLSFMPAGCVERAPVDEVQYRITELGEREGKALAGHALAISLEADDISLRSLYGMSKKGPGRDNRPPLDRLRIFRMLLGSDDLQTANIQAELGVAGSTAVNNLRWLDADGIIEYEGIRGKTIGDHIIYGLPESFDGSADTGHSEMRRIVHETVGALVSDGVRECNMLDLMATLQERYPEAGFERENRRKYARIIMNELADDGQVTKGPFGGPRRSKITLREEARPVVERAVAIADGMLSGSPAFIEEGREQLAAILKNEGSVRFLVRKAFKASPDSNRVPRQDSFRHTRAVLADGPLSSSEACARLGEHGLTPSSAKRTLELLRIKGDVMSKQMPGGRELSWELVAPRVA